MKELTLEQTKEVDGAWATIAAGALIGGFVNGASSYLSGNGFTGAFIAGAASGALIGSGVGLFTTSAVAGTSLIGLGVALGVSTTVDVENANAGQ